MLKLKKIEMVGNVPDAHKSPENASETPSRIPSLARCGCVAMTDSPTPLLVATVVREGLSPFRACK